MPMRYVIMLVAALLLFGCVLQPQAGNQSNATNASHPVISGGNASSPANATQAGMSLPPGYTVSIGDHVWVNYSLYVNGTLLDTNDPVLARQSGIYNSQRKYGPFDFDVQFNKGIIDGFLLGVIDMKVNDTQVFDVDPARGYGPYDPKKVITVDRYYTRNLTESVPRSFFVQQGINVSQGEGFDTQFGTVFIQDFNDENVTIFYLGLVDKGFNFTFNGLPQQVVESSNLTTTIERMLEVGKVYQLPDPATGSPVNFRVLGKTNQSITLDGNNPLANDTLHFTVKVLKIQHGNYTVGDAGG
jgi:FKBP-type peptidyl-prolyl cis-trans isomerase 2